MSKEGTSAILSAICRRLLSTLGELSLECLELFRNASAPVNSWTDDRAITSSLKTLKITDVSFLELETSRGKHIDFVGRTLCALTSSSSIYSLFVDASFAAQEYGASFKPMLVNPSGPAKLSVLAHNRVYEYKANFVFETLVTATTVKKMCVGKFALRPNGITSLSKILVSSATIEDISCALCHWHLRIQGDDEHLVKGLSKTTSLRCLAIQYRFLPCGIHAVLAAVRDSDSVSELHLQKLDFRELQTFYNALVAASTGPKVTVGCWIACDHHMTALAIRTWSELRTGGQELFFGSGLRRHHHQPSVVDFCRALDERGRDNLT
ncbi:hypothetical protein V5799_024872 [Amblyomma americanum]|uniref:Uncharacterized protein n=1 Tax=Amblyomma americanum TaxID=6943 RepID=A0AAQ4EAY0_AMBAM